MSAFPSAFVLPRPSSLSSIVSSLPFLTVFPIDYSKTFTSVVKPTIVRLVLMIAFSKGWKIQQLDVHNAFLNGSLHEVVYMKQPLGFVNPAFPTHVCRLYKSLYGLKQALRAWYMRLSDFLMSICFWASKVDTSLFILNVNHDICYLLVYVDDILLTGNNSDLIQRLITLLSSVFNFLIWVMLIIF